MSRVLRGPRELFAEIISDGAEFHSAPLFCFTAPRIKWHRSQFFSLLPLSLPLSLQGRGNYFLCTSAKSVLSETLKQVQGDGRSYRNWTPHPTFGHPLPQRGEGTSFAPSVRKSALPPGARELVLFVPLRGFTAPRDKRHRSQSSPHQRMR